MWSISHLIMPLVINALRGHTDNKSNFKKPGLKIVSLFLVTNNPVILAAYQVT